MSETATMQTTHRLYYSNALNSNITTILVEGAGPVQPQHELLQALVCHGEGLAGDD